MASILSRFSLTALAPALQRVVSRPVTTPPKVKRTRPPVALNVAAAGLSAVVTMAFAGSFGQLVFDGALAPHVGRGILAALLSSVIMLFVLPWRGAFPFSIGGPDSNPSAVLAVTLAAIVSQVAASGTLGADELMPTVLMFVFGSAAACGLVIWWMGARRAGRYVRYIPHPVVGGFLAGSGYLLVAGAFKILTGARLTFEALPAILQVHPFAGVTALVVAAALLVLTSRVRHCAVIPAVIVAALVGFHVVRYALGLDLAAARAAGLLLPPLEIGAWTNVATVSWSDVRWDVLLLHGKDIGAMITVVVVTALLNTTSIELATGHEANADRELRAIGIGNVIAGLCGGMIASNSLNRTLLHWRAGGAAQWSAWLCAALLCVTLAAAPGIVGLLPRPVLTGLILYLGATLLIAWVGAARHTLTRMDYLVVLTILAIVIAFGIVAGVVCGMFIACVSLAVTLSRSPNVRHSFTAQNRRANVERTPEQIERLRAHGGALRGFTLQGVLFFGTATHVLETIRAELLDTRIVLLDFRLVHGIDGSSIVVLNRVQGICREAGVKFVLTGLTRRMESLLRRGGFQLDAEHVRRFADLDRGLEWCEEFLLGESAAVASLASVLGAAFTAEQSELLYRACERRQVAAGETLVRQGDPSNEMFFLERGRVHVLLRLGSGGADGSKRLRTYGPGTVVGEMGFYSGEPRSADIVADAETHALCLTRERLAEIESTQPELGRAIHRFVIQVLSQRLRSANDEIRLLL